MDYQSAIQSHIGWKQRLADYLRMPDGSLNSDHLSSDCRCSLGQWIYGRGLMYGDLPEYLVLRSEHARFHRCAGELVKQADLNILVSDDEALGGDGEFAISSAAVVAAITAMKEKIDHLRAADSSATS